MEPAETQSLRLAIERSLRGAFDPADVLPRLARLARLAAPASDDGVFANHKLAELLVERDPWRAALYVRRALAHRPNDDRPWAILAFCQTLLGNFRCAASAYKKAIACAPSNPWYAHNLGHLLDVALGEPSRAIDWLKLAYQAKSDNSEIVASYAHALARASRTDEARAVLERARARFGASSSSRSARELDALVRWLDQGAPAEPVARRRRTKKKVAAEPRDSLSLSRSSRAETAESLEDSLPRPPRALSGAPRAETAESLEDSLSGAPRAETAESLEDSLPRPPRAAPRALSGASRAETAESLEDSLPRPPRAASRAGRVGSTPSRSRSARGPMPKRLATILRRGLSNLPLHDAQRERALELARDALPAPRVAEDVAGLAAAVAYAIVYIDHVPLSQAEVAAPFRVGVADLRGRFAELRAKLDIIRGDARYATTRR